MMDNPYQVAALSGATSEDEDHRRTGAAILQIIAGVSELAGFDGVTRGKLHGWERSSDADEQGDGGEELHFGGCTVVAVWKGA